MRSFPAASPPMPALERCGLAPPRRNLLVTARAVGALPGSVREVVRASFTPEVYRLRALLGLEAAYQRPK